MLRTLTRAAVACAALLLMGCGQDREARGMVEDFMKTGLGLTDYDVVEWSRVDSAFFVSDSVLQAMRAQAAGQVRGATYAKATPKLLYLHVRYAVGSDTLRKTFYIDDAMSGIVGFKEN